MNDSWLKLKQNQKNLASFSRRVHVHPLFLPDGESYSYLSDPSTSFSLKVLKFRPTAELRPLIQQSQEAQDDETPLCAGGTRQSSHRSQHTCAGIAPLIV